MRFNRAGDKALVDLVFRTAEDRLTYTATFHRQAGLWKLRGVRETLQEFIMDGLPVPLKPFLPAPPDPVIAPLDLPGLPEKAPPR